MCSQTIRGRDSVLTKTEEQYLIHSQLTPTASLETGHSTHESWERRDHPPPFDASTCKQAWSSLLLTYLYVSTVRSPLRKRRKEMEDWEKGKKGICIETRRKSERGVFLTSTTRPLT